MANSSTTNGTLPCARKRPGESSRPRTPLQVCMSNYPDVTDRTLAAALGCSESSVRNYRSSAVKLSLQIASGIAVFLDDIVPPEEDEPGFDVNLLLGTGPEMAIWLVENRPRVFALLSGLVAV